MKILIVEPESKGHHFVLYLNKLINEFKKRNFDIDLVTSKKAVNTEAYKIIKKNNKSFNTYTFDYDLSLKNKFFLFKIFFQISYFYIVIKKVIKLSKKNKYDAIYFNHLDPFFYVYAFFGFFVKLKNINGLLLNCKFHHSYYKFKNNIVLDKLKFFLFKLFIKNKNISKIFLVDYLIKDFLSFNNYKSKKIIFINEAFNEIKTINKYLARRKFKFKEKGKYILVYGAITARKGLIELIDAVSSDDNLNEYSIIVAGVIQNKFYNILRNREGFKKLIKNKKLYILNKFISENEERQLFSSTDFVWLGYNNNSSDSSSGVLNLSVMAEKIIIASNRGLIAKIVKSNRIGYIYNSNLRIMLKKILKKKNYQKIKNNIKKYKSKLKLKIFEKTISSNI